MSYKTNISKMLKIITFALIISLFASNLVSCNSKLPQTYSGHYTYAETEDLTFRNGLIYTINRGIEGKDAVLICLTMKSLLEKDCYRIESTSIRGFIVTTNFLVILSFFEDKPVGQSTYPIHAMYTYRLMRMSLNTFIYSLT